MPHESNPLRVYISGPIRGIPNGNKEKFDLAEKVLRRQGYDVFNPKGVHPMGTPWADCIPTDLQDLRGCNRISFIEGWEGSYGCTIEALFALGAEIQVIKQYGIAPFSDLDPSVYLPKMLPIRLPDGFYKVNKPGVTPVLEYLGLKLGPVVQTVPFVAPREMLYPFGKPPTETLHYSEGKSGVDQIPPEVLMALGNVYSYGEKKYSRGNWLRGTNWHEFYGSALRHMFRFWRGEWLDDESGLPHLAHAIWNLSTLFVYHQHKIGKDTRDAVLND